MAPGFVFAVQSTTALPYPDATFDLVVAREVIEHIPVAELGPAIAEMKRVLRPGGGLLLTTPSKRRRLPDKHFQHFSAAQLRELLGTAGFEVGAVRGFGWWPQPLLETGYRYLIGLPSLWRVHAALGTREMSLDQADDLLALGCRRAG
jgi:SAM-dependent methyltransferase